MSNDERIESGQNVILLFPFLYSYLDQNALSCVETGVLGDCPRLEIVSLNGNNLTTLPAGMFDRITDLRILRLSDNMFYCDCNLGWLARWLRVCMDWILDPLELYSFM